MNQALRNKIEKLKGQYFFESYYHKDKRLLPFTILGKSMCPNYPVKVKTVEYKGFIPTYFENNYKIECIEGYLKSGLIFRKKNQLELQF